MPEVNEPHYLAKAKHFWQADWASRDLFLNSTDAHHVFYWTCGWWTRWLTLVQTAWLGRCLTLFLLAWSWLRLVRQITIRPGVAPLSALVLLALIEHGHMAGEWLVGGFEAKGLAYVLVWCGLAQLVRRRWRWVWPLLGLAASFHVLVGGWSVVAALFVWLCEGKRRLPLSSMWPWLVIGGLAAAPGLVPALLMSYGQPPEMIRDAQKIYVYFRLPHHLYLPAMPAFFVARFAALTLAWACLIGVRRTLPPCQGRMGGRERRLQAFVLGCLLIAMLGALLSLADLAWYRLYQVHLPGAAGLLRFYWFRLSDIMAPVGLGLSLAIIACRFRTGTSKRGIPWLPVAVSGMLILTSLMFSVEKLTAVVWPRPAPALQGTEQTALVEWQAACAWAGRETPSDALFFTPRESRTFRWYADRGEVVSWKDIPQEPQDILDWQRRLIDIHYNRATRRWFTSLAERSPADLKRLAERYQTQYLIAENYPSLRMPVVYRNAAYTIYELSPVADVPR